jgi:hypothetical protein
MKPTKVIVFRPCSTNRVPNQASPIMNQIQARSQFIANVRITYIHVVLSFDGLMPGTALQISYQTVVRDSPQEFNEDDRL